MNLRMFSLIILSVIVYGTTAIAGDLNGCHVYSDSGTTDHVGGIQGFSIIGDSLSLITVNGNLDAKIVEIETDISGHHIRLTDYSQDIRIEWPNENSGSPAEIAEYKRKPFAHVTLYTLCVPRNTDDGDPVCFPGEMTPTAISFFHCQGK